MPASIDLTVRGKSTVGRVPSANEADDPAPPEPYARGLLYFYHGLLRIVFYGWVCHPQPGGRVSGKPEYIELQAEFSFSNSLIFLSAILYVGSVLFRVFRLHGTLKLLDYLFKRANLSGKCRQFGEYGN